MTKRKRELFQSDLKENSYHRYQESSLEIQIKESFENHQYEQLFKQLKDAPLISFSNIDLIFRLTREKDNVSEKTPFLKELVYCATNILEKNVNNNEKPNSGQAAYILSNYGQLLKKISLPMLSDKCFNVLFDRFGHCTKPPAQRTGIKGIHLITQHFRIKFNTSQVQRCFKTLRHHQEVDSETISLFIYHLGLISRSKNLDNNISTDELNVLLNRFKKLSVTPICISHIIYGLGLMAENLNGRIATKSLNILLDTLLDILNKPQDIPRISQVITNIFYGLGLIAKYKKLDDNISANGLNALLNILKGFPIIPPDIAMTFCGLGLLAQFQNIDGNISEIDTLTRLLDQPKNLSIQNIMLILEGLNALEKYQNFPIKSRQLVAWFQLALEQPYVHPTLVADLIHHVVSFKESHGSDLQDLYEILVDNLQVPLAFFSLFRQKQLKNDMQSWESSKALSRRHERRATVNKTMINTPHELQQNNQRPIQKQRRTPLADAQFLESNPIFKAIYEKDLSKLMTLFSQSIVPVSRPSSKTEVISPRTQKTSSKIAFPLKEKNTPLDSLQMLVMEFFSKTKPQALQELIKQSEAKYFSVLLKALSLHLCYRLAKKYLLHPLLIHLPLLELQELINNFISPFQFYRDHQALLCIIDALNIRISQNTQDTQVIRSCKEILHQKGIDFHKQMNNTHVIEKIGNLSDSLIEYAQEKVSITFERNTVTTAKKRATSTEILLPTISMMTPTPGVNEQYEYLDIDMDALLKARFQGPRFSHVKILAATQINPGINVNGVVPMLQQFLDENNLSPAPKPYILLMPIQIQGHWIGLSIEITAQKNITKICYYNSLRSSLNNHETPNYLKNMLLQAQLISPEFVFDRYPLECFQSDSTSCGPFLIENFYQNITGISWTPGTDLSTRIRRRHLDLLEQYNENLYEAFRNRQMGVIPDVILSQERQISDSLQRDTNLSSNSNLDFTSNLNVFFPPKSSLKPINLSDLQYSYSANDIDKLLPIRFKNLDVQLLKAIKMETNFEPQIITSTIKTALKDSSSKELVLPFEINGTWIGFYLTVNHKKITKMTIFNSLKSFYFDHEINSLVLTLQKQELLTADCPRGVAEDSFGMKNLDKIQTGPLLVENLSCFKRKIYWDPGTQPQQIRVKHQYCLSTLNPKNQETQKKEKAPTERILSL